MTAVDSGPAAVDTEIDHPAAGSGGAAAPRSPAHAARLRSLLAAALGLMIAVVLARLASLPLTNGDTYFHLRFGHEFLSGAWSLRHPGSVTSYATADWLPTQWLSEVVMAQVEEWFGLAGVAWLSGLQFLTLALALYWACRRQAEPLVSVLLVAVALVACTPGMSMRPQVLSYILVVVTTSAWLQAGQTGRAPWLLVPVTWVWTMCHGMWPVGIAIGAVAVVGLALDRRHPTRTMARMAAVPVLSGVVSLLTPVGPGILAAVMQVNSRHEYFYEWGPPDYHEGYSFGLLLLLALAVLPRLRRQRADWLSIGLIGLAALWAVYSLRTLPVAACLAAPLAAAAVQPALGLNGRFSRRERLLSVGIAACALAGLAVAVPHTASSPSHHPAWVAPALDALPAGTKVLADSSDGGYLMWRFPQLDLVTHGYGDTFTDAELRRNFDIESVRPGWADDVRQTDVDFALVAPSSPLGYALEDVEQWRVVDGSGDLLLLAPPPGWMEADR